MDNLDISNAITTLNTVYFFKCAENQGTHQAALEDILIERFNISREIATQIIYMTAPYYYENAFSKDCIDYVIKHTQALLNAKEVTLS